MVLTIVDRIGSASRADEEVTIMSKLPIRFLALLAGLFAISLAACGGESRGEGDDDGSADADTDTDADADTDADTDTGDFVPGECDECPLNSGYPCPCNGTCQDDSWCVYFDEDDMLGYCARPCDADVECETEMNCWSEPSCSIISPDEERFCRLHCTDNSECPEDMVCAYPGGPNTGTCYPNAEALCCHEDDPCNLGSNGLCDCGGAYELDWDFQDCAPDYVDVHFISAAIAPAKADMSVWDGVGSIPDGVWNAFWLIGPEAAMFTDVADFLAESAVQALNKPDPYGFAQLDTGDGYGPGVDLATAENNVSETFLPVWPGDPAFINVPFNPDSRIRVHLWDEDGLDADDDIGLAVIDYDTLVEAYLNGGAFYFNTAAQTYNQLWFLGFEVY